MSDDVDELAEVIRSIDGPATLGGLEVADAIIAAGYVRVRVDEETAERVARAIQESRCGCCEEYEVFRHQARAVLDALTEDQP